MAKEVVRVALKKQYNGRFTFTFKSLEVTLEVANRINRMCYFDNPENKELMPRPFHYIVEQKKQATVPLYINLQEYLDAIESLYPGRFTIKLEVLLNDPKRKVNLKLMFH